MQANLDPSARSMEELRPQSASVEDELPQVRSITDEIPQSPSANEILRADSTEVELPPAPPMEDERPSITMSMSRRKMLIAGLWLRDAHEWRGPSHLIERDDIPYLPSRIDCYAFFYAWPWRVICFTILAMQFAAPWLFGVVTLKWPTKTEPVGWFWVGIAWDLIVIFGFAMESALQAYCVRESKQNSINGNLRPAMILLMTLDVVVAMCTHAFGRIDTVRPGRLLAPVFAAISCNSNHMVATFLSRILLSIIWPACLAIAHIVSCACLGHLLFSGGAVTSPNHNFTSITQSIGNVALIMSTHDDEMMFLTSHNNFVVILYLFYVYAGVLILLNLLVSEMATVLNSVQETMLRRRTLARSHALTGVFGMFDTGSGINEVDWGDIAQIARPELPSAHAAALFRAVIAEQSNGTDAHCSTLTRSNWDMIGASLFDMTIHEQTQLHHDTPEDGDDVGPTLSMMFGAFSNPSERASPVLRFVMRSNVVFIATVVAIITGVYLDLEWIVNNANSGVNVAMGVLEIIFVVDLVVRFVAFGRPAVVLTGIDVLDTMSIIVAAFGFIPYSIFPYLRLATLLRCLRLIGPLTRFRLSPSASARLLPFLAAFTTFFVCVVFSFALAGNLIFQGIESNPEARQLLIRTADPGLDEIWSRQGMYEFTFVSFWGSMSVLMQAASPRWYNIAKGLSILNPVDSLAKFYFALYFAVVVLALACLFTGVVLLGYRHRGAEFAADVKGRHRVFEELAKLFPKTPVESWLLTSPNSMCQILLDNLRADLLDGVLLTQDLDQCVRGNVVGSDDRIDHAAGPIAAPEEDVEVGVVRLPSAYQKPSRIPDSINYDSDGEAPRAFPRVGSNHSVSFDVIARTQP